MIAELYQKSLFSRRKIVIYDTKIVYQPKKNENEMSFSYEDITSYKENYTTQIKHIKKYIYGFSYLAGASFFLTNFINNITFLWIFFVVAAIGVLGVQLIFQENVWKIRLQNGTYIFINKTLPNENEVNNFIDQLFKQRNKYLRETYLFVNKNLEYELQFRNLQWLRQIEVIGSEEFDILRKELDVLFNTEKKLIGF